MVRMIFLQASEAKINAQLRCWRSADHRYGEACDTCARVMATGADQ